MTNQETLIYNWVFNYNIYTKKWQAVKREHYQELFNGGSHVIRSSDINTLVSIINKTDGNSELLEKIIKE